MTFFGHPRGLALLFGVEMWERFSYYGMRALLVLYLVNAMHWSDADAANLYGTYTSLAYAVQIGGGFLSDRFLGTRRSLVIGGAIIAAGHFVLALQSMATFYLGLVLVVAGTGLFKPNVSTMVGQLYEKGDRRRDSGFTIFYIGINVGATVAPLVTGYLAERIAWHYGFAAAGVGMLFGLGLFIWGKDRYLAGIGTTPALRVVSTEPTGREHDTRNRIIALLTIFAFVAVFWMGYDQSGSSLNLFTDRHVNRQFGSTAVPTSWFQSVQPFAVLVLAPLFAALWLRLGKVGREPSTPAKMSIGLALLAASFVVLVFAGRQADAGRMVSASWIVVAYVIQVLGELCLSPVGLSFVTKTAPARYAALLMSAWFLANGIGDKLSGSLAAIAPTMAAARFFTIFIVASAVAAALLALLVPWLRRTTEPTRAIPTIAALTAAPASPPR